MNHSNLSDDLYREQILELYKNPQNFGNLKNPTHKHTENNSICGDEITVQLIVEKNMVKDIRFHGSGCVMSMVSSSLLTNKVKGMKVEDIKKLTKEDVLDLLKIKLNPGRIKCALLPLDSIKNSLK